MLSCEFLLRRRVGTLAACAIIVVCLARTASASAQSLFPAGCDFPRDAGKLREVTITDAGPRMEPPASHDPAVDVRLEYPENYAAYPFPLGPSPKPRQSGENFLMELNGAPLPWVGRHTDDGKPTRPSDLPPNFRFLLYDRYSIDRVIAIDVRNMTGLKWSFEMPPIQTAPAEIDGLIEITNKKVPAYDREQLLMAKQGDGSFSDEIVCKRHGSVKFAQCKHMFDYRGVDLWVSYDRNLLPKWREIKDLIKAFMRCTYKEETLTNSKGSWKWD